MALPAKMYPVITENCLSLMISWTISQALACALVRSSIYIRSQYPLTCSLSYLRASHFRAENFIGSFISSTFKFVMELSLEKRRMRLAA